MTTKLMSTRTSISDPCQKATI